MGKVAFEITVDGMPTARQNLNAVRSCMQDLKKDVELVAYAFAGWQAAQGGLEWLRDSTSEILNTGMAMQKLNAQFSTIGGSARIGAGELGFVRAEAKRLGLDFMALTTQYANLLNATRGTSLEGSPTRDMFSGLAEGLGALQKSGDEQQRIFAQLNQMMTKQKIELEDAKVIAEAGIPIYNMLAAAIGKSTPEMMQMMSTGQLLSMDVLPKLGQSFHAQFGEKAVAAGDLAQGAINKFKNELKYTKAEFAEQFLPTFAAGLNTITSNIEVLKTAALGLGATLAANVATRIGVNTVAPAVAGQMPYLRNALNENSGAVALNSAAANKMRATAALEAARAEEIDAAQTLANAMAQEKRLMALHASGAMYQRLAATEAQRAAGLQMQTQAYAGLAVAQRTTATAAAAHEASQNAVTSATVRYATAADAASLSTRAMAAASKAAQGVMAFFGGPIGLIITGLTLAATAWATYSAREEQADKQNRSTLESMREQVRTLEERNRLASFKGNAAQNYNDAEAKQLAYLQQRVEEAAAKNAASVYDSDAEAHRKALADLQEFYDLKKRLTTEKEAEAGRLAQQQAKEKADQEKMLAEKLADDMRRLAEAKLKNQVEAVKNSGALELAALQDRYEQGLVATRDYYDKVLSLADKSSQAEMKLLTSQRSSLQSELDKMLKAKNGKEDEKTVAVRVKLEENSGSIAKLKGERAADIQKTTAELQKGLREISQASAEAEAADLERQGRFVETWRVRKEAYEKTPEYLRLIENAFKNGKESEEAFWNKEREWQNTGKEGRLKEIQAIQDVQNAVVALKNERLQTLGVGESEFKLAALDREEKQKIAVLEAQLEAARAARNPLNISRYRSEIAATRELYEMKRKITNEELSQEAFKAKQSMLASELTLAEARGDTQKADAIRQQIAAAQSLNEAENKLFELTNRRKGYEELLSSAIQGNNSAEQSRYTQLLSWQQDEIFNWQEIIRLRQEAAWSSSDTANKARAGISQSDNSSESKNSGSTDVKPDAFGNLPNSPYYIGKNLTFLGGFATGSPYIPADGYAYLHKGEAVLTSRENSSLADFLTRTGGKASDPYGHGYNDRVSNVDAYMMRYGLTTEVKEYLSAGGASELKYPGAMKISGPFLDEILSIPNSYINSDYSLGFAPRSTRANSYYSSSAGNQTFNVNFGDIIVQGGSTGTETAREIARAIYPELQKLSGRRIAA